MQDQVQKLTHDLMCAGQPRLNSWTAMARAGRLPWYKNISCPTPVPSFSLSPRYSIWFLSFTTVLFTDTQWIPNVSYVSWICIEQ